MSSSDDKYLTGRNPDYVPRFSAPRDYAPRRRNLDPDLEPPEFPDLPPAHLTRRFHKQDALAACERAEEAVRQRIKYGGATTPYEQEQLALARRKAEEMPDV